MGLGFENGQELEEFLADRFIRPDPRERFGEDPGPAAPQIEKEGGQESSCRSGRETSGGHEYLSRVEKRDPFRVVEIDQPAQAAGKRPPRDLGCCREVGRLRSRDQDHLVSVELRQCQIRLGQKLCQVDIPAEGSQL